MRGEERPAASVTRQLIGYGERDRRPVVGRGASTCNDLSVSATTTTHRGSAWRTAKGSTRKFAVITNVQ